MNLSGKEKLLKHAKRDKKLLDKCNEFVLKFEKANFSTSRDIKEIFPDVDLITSESYIFNLDKANRTLVVIFFNQDYAQIAWAGNHDDYMRKFDSRSKILKFLKKEGFLD